MKAAIVSAAGVNPVYTDFSDPVEDEDSIAIDVTAAALSQLARMRASGTHYSVEPTFPFVAGVDGVGCDPAGKRVYFFLPNAPHGSFADRTLVARANCVPIPPELSDTVAAAIAIPGMSSWAALTQRAHLRSGETVLIHGATGTSGRLAVQIAKHLGAAKVIATGRNQERLAELGTLGADVVIPLTENLALFADQCAAEIHNGVDIICDYLWGEAAAVLIETIAQAAKPSQTLRFVQIGSIAGATITLPASPLRATGLTLMGSGLGSVHHEALLASFSSVFQAVAPAHLHVAAKTVPLADLASNWTNSNARDRIVFVP